eukprot:356503-Chlamydomonas_euryale.AAC.2
MGTQREEQQARTPRRRPGAADMQAAVPLEVSAAQQQPGQHQGQQLLWRCWRVLAAVLLSCWLCATLAGTLSHDGGALLAAHAGKRPPHPLSRFDAAFRAAGPLLPLLPWLLRAAPLEAVAMAGAAAAPGCGARATLAWPCLAAYLVVCAARMLLYLAHVVAQGGGGAGGGHGGWLSDHIFLAASVVACLSVELGACAADAMRLDGGGLHTRDGRDCGGGSGGVRRRAAVGAAAAVALLLYGLVCADMFVTCRHFHQPTESLAALLGGLVCFQVPMLVWFTAHAARSDGKARGGAVPDAAERAAR